MVETQEKPEDVTENQTAETVKETYRKIDEDALDKANDGTNGSEDLSNYAQNIKASSPGIGEKDHKEAGLLPDSKTVIRFSPVWKQVRKFMILVLIRVFVNYHRIS